MAIGQRYGVKDNAVRKWCKRYGIAWPPLGYWQRIHAGWSHEDAKNPPAPKPKQSIKILRDETVIEILKAVKEGQLSLRMIAKIYGSNRVTVSGIKDGTRYKHVPRNEDIVISD